MKKTKKLEKLEQSKKVGFGLEDSKIEEDDEEYKDDSSEDGDRKLPFQRNRKYSEVSSQKQYRSLDNKLDDEQDNGIDFVNVHSDNNSQ